MNQDSGHQPPAAGSAAAEWGLQAAQSMLRRMLDSADDTLFELSGRKMSDEERRGCFDAMRVLRKSGPALARGFDQALRPGGIPAPAPAAVITAPSGELTLSLRADDDVQQEITAGNTAGRVDNLAQQMLWEYGLRVAHIPANSDIRAKLEGLRPKALVAAFNAALQALELGPEIRPILFKLFERQLMADANAYFESLNTKLEAEGFTDKAVPARRTESAVFGSGGGGGGAGAAPPSYSVPSTLVNSLSQWGLPSNSWQAAPETQATFTAGAPQRLTLVSQLIDETGSRWPREEMDALRRLILPIVQIALSDSSFFSDAKHPARTLISGLESLAAEPAPARSARLAAAETALRGLQQQYRPPASVAPLAQSELQGFLSSQRSPKTDTSARMASAKAAAHEQVKAAGSGYELPVGLAPFLTEVWIPLVSALSLRFGVGTPEWTRSKELLQRLFGECRWLTGHVEPALVDTILDDVSGEMRVMAVPPNLVLRACTLLRDGLSSEALVMQRLDLETFAPRGRSAGAPTKPQEKSAAGPADHLVDWRAGMPVGAWFRVFDRRTNRTLWMTADVFYPEAASVSFTGFDAQVRINVGKSEFLGDLRDGKAEAVNASPAQAEAIARLVASVTKAAA
ncbi:uncharacterized protein DUF1631 [Panacagrimonas perspica]|uniref:Uncharacterized protein DUF1631 n=1 Tax=Panacagrimonas perspica TaxID=381431 RepID=A0A4S3K1E6_9GAMM|nr:DUF1631 family protein [Panacagrimonas perspica]TDU31083.1 uncharacterized protein DUF1631 [Panacagrimonas perspica]THD01777.1 hypothetical protein B1810_17360 [Panacagrimonas perspica]